MQSRKYSHASHTHQVMLASKARIGARIVLQFLCTRAEFDEPTVTVTKSQISRGTGLERKAIQRALNQLRAEGVLVPIRGFEGGRGIATTYRLEVVGQGAEGCFADDRAGRIREARSRIMAENPRLTWSEAQELAKKSA